MSLQKFLIKTSAISDPLDLVCPRCRSVFFHFDGHSFKDIVKRHYVSNKKHFRYVLCSFSTPDPWQSVVKLRRCHQCESYSFCLEMRVSLAPGLMGHTALEQFDSLNADQSNPRAYFLGSSPLIRLRWLGLRLLIDNFEAELHRFPPCPIYKNPKQFGDIFNDKSPGWIRISRICTWLYRLYQPFQAIPGVRDLSLLSLTEES
jgi:hypothetical protein